MKYYFSGVNSPELILKEVHLMLTFHTMKGKHKETPKPDERMSRIVKQRKEKKK